MQVLVKCLIFDGRATSVAGAAGRARRIVRVRDGRVLRAWRAVEGRIGFALLEITSMAMVPTLLNEAFPDARRIDVDKVVAAETVSAAVQYIQSSATGETRQTGT